MARLLDAGSAVPKLLYLLPDLLHGGAARQVCRLAAGLASAQWEVRVAVLHAAGPLRTTLEAASVAVVDLDWRRPLDPAPLRRWRDLLEQWRPDVIHAATLPAVRLAALVRSRHPARRVVSHLLPTAQGRTRLAWADCWLARRADHVVVGGAVEAGWLRHLGLTPPRVAVIPPGVDDAPSPGPRRALCRQLGLPEDARLVVCVGPFRRHKGFADVIWAFDMLRDLIAELHLIVAGDGPDRRRLEHFAQGIRLLDRTHFVGTLPDVSNLVANAEVVLVPSLRPGGRTVALEAMAAGVPVVATRLAYWEEVVRDGETGLLVPVGDQQTMARRTRALLADPERRRQLGEAGRRWVREHFPADAMLRNHAALYSGQSVT